MIVQEIKQVYLKFCETNPHDDKYPISTVDIESLFGQIEDQASIISQQSAEIERLMRANENVHASLKLAVKALEVELKAAKTWDGHGTVKHIKDTITEIRHLSGGNKTSCLNGQS